MSANISYTNMPVGYEKLWWVPKFGSSSSFGGINAEASAESCLIYGVIAI